MEKLLHYIWKHRILPLSELRTTDGRSVEVIDPGLLNMHAGPDFFNAKVRIDGVMWVGNVEIHERSADWFLHGHDTDAAYNNVVLHVAAVVDADVVTERGDHLPQVQLAVPQQVLSNYRRRPLSALPRGSASARCHQETLVAQCACCRAPQREDGGDTPPRSSVRGLVGGCVLRHYGAQLRLRREQRGV